MAKETLFYFTMLCSVTDFPLHMHYKLNVDIIILIFSCKSLQLTNPYIYRHVTLHKYNAWYGTLEYILYNYNYIIKNR